MLLSFGVKGLSLLIALFTTPAYLHYFNDDSVLGVWFTLLTVLSWILSCDMGMGNGLRNKLTVALASGNVIQAKRLISSAYWFICFLSIFVVALILACVQFVDWNFIFNVDKAVLSGEVLSVSAAIVLGAICAQMVLRLVTSILYALQKAFVPSLLNLITNTCLLLYVLISNAIGQSGDMELLAIAYFFSVNIPLGVATVLVFRGSLKAMRPSLRYFDKNCAMDTLKLGGAFLWLQIMALLLNSAGSYLVSIFINPAAVVEYQIYYKIFVMASTLIALGAAPIWSAATKAQAEKNYVWLKSLYRKFLAIGMAVVVCEYLLCLPLQPIFNFWLGGASIPVNNTTAFIFATYGSLMVLSGVVTCFANGLGELKCQTIFLTLGAILNIPLAFFLAQILGNMTAIVIANIIAYIPYLFIQTIWVSRHLSKKAKDANSA